MIRFGTDGVRGRAGWWPCTPEVAMAAGRAAARLAGGGRVLVLRDTRPSGAMLEAAVAAGVAGEGATALLGGVLPTSALSAALAAGLADAGVMLTASHNPCDDNGFKVFGPTGAKLSDDDTARVEAWLAQPGEATPGRITSVDARASYLAALEAAIDLDALRGRRVAIDLANGAATALGDWLAARLPGVVLLGNDGGAINEGVGSQHPEHLARAVRELRCEAGFAVDGDADRCLLVDERGQAVPGDGLAWLLARGAGVSCMAVTVMSNAGLAASLPDVRLVVTPVGDRHLAAAMAREALPLGCEESGHVLFSDALPTGDGLVTGLRALRHAFALGPVSGALAGYRAFPRRLTRVRVSERPPLDRVAPLEAARVAGLERLGPGGRVFLRYSGTEPLLRLLVEGADEQTVNAVSAELTRVASEALR